MFSSLFAAHILRGESAKSSLEKTANAVYKVMKSTFDKKRRELDLISCQDFFVEDTAEFKATKI
jgi:pyridoxine kinase